jgi:hypothetical protein
MTDDDGDATIEELKRKTSRSDRVEEEGRRAETAEFRERVERALEEIDAGDRQKTVSVWDGPLAAFMAAVDDDKKDENEKQDREYLEDVGTALQEKLGEDVDAEAVDRSEVLRLALRLGFREAAPEYLDAARDTVRDHEAPDL